MTKRAPISFDPAPVTNAARRKAAKDEASEKGGTEMLSGRVSTVKARQFRSLAKLQGEKVQTLLDAAIGEYIERHRI
jgi:hypothetical protein